MVLSESSGGGVGYLSMDVERNLKRSAETISDLDKIAGLEDEIAALRERARKLQEQNKNRMLAASLRFRGLASDWYSLSEEKKWKKRKVLVILSCTKNEGNLPRLLREDNDIFIARVRRSDFQKYSTTRNERQRHFCPSISQRTWCMRL